MDDNKILVIDDELAIVDIVKEALESEGFQVIGASNGVEGLERLHKDSPDLVVLDVLMPGMDGWEVLRRIEADAATAGVPVIMLTALGGDEDILRGLEEGAVEYITKPFHLQDLIACVRIQLQVFDPLLRKQRRQALIAKRRRFLTRWPAS